MDTAEETEMPSDHYTKPSFWLQGWSNIRPDDQFTSLELFKAWGDTALINLL